VATLWPATVRPTLKARSNQAGAAVTGSTDRPPAEPGSIDSERDRPGRPGFQAASTSPAAGAARAGSGPGQARVVPEIPESQRVARSRPRSGIVLDGEGPGISGRPGVANQHAVILRHATNWNH